MQSETESGGLTLGNKLRAGASCHAALLMRRREERNAAVSMGLCKSCSRPLLRCDVMIFRLLFVDVSSAWLRDVSMASSSYYTWRFVDASYRATDTILETGVSHSILRFYSSWLCRRKGRTASRIA